MSSLSTTSSIYLSCARFNIKGKACHCCWLLVDGYGIQKHIILNLHLVWPVYDDLTIGIIVHSISLLVTRKGSRNLCPEKRKMEEQGGNDNLLHFMSMNFDGKANEVSHLPEDVPAQHLAFADGESGEQINALPLPHEWIQTPKFSHNYVEYLAESSTFLPKATTEDMLESIPSNVGGIHAVVGGISEIQSDISYNNSLGKAPASKPAGSFYGMDASKVNP